VLFALLECLGYPELTATVCAGSVSQRSVRRRLTSILRVGAVEPEEGRKVVAVPVPRATSEWTPEVGERDASKRFGIRVRAAQR